MTSGLLNSDAAISAAERKLPSETFRFAADVICESILADPTRWPSSDDEALSLIVQSLLDARSAALTRSLTPREAGAFLNLATPFAALVLQVGLSKAEISQSRRAVAAKSLAAVAGVAAILGIATLVAAGSSSLLSDRLARRS